MELRSLHVRKKRVVDSAQNSRSRCLIFASYRNQKKIISKSYFSISQRKNEPYVWKKRPKTIAMAGNVNGYGTRLLLALLVVLAGCVAVSAALTVPALQHRLHQQHAGDADRDQAVVLHRVNEKQNVNGAGYEHDNHNEEEEEKEKEVKEKEKGFYEQTKGSRRIVDDPVAVSEQIVSCGPDAPERWTIASADGMVISAGARVAGAVDSITLDGVQYINACDHGRELQMAITTTYGECYNPTEGGAMNDAGGAASTSVLQGVNTDGNVLRTTSFPAFWLWPGTCEAGCGCAKNTQKVSGYQMDKAIQFNPFGIAHSFYYLADIHIPETVPALQLESPTAYMPGNFSKFYTVDPTSGALTAVASPGHSCFGSPHPVVIATPDDQHAMAAISAQPVSYYGLFDFSDLQPSATQATTKWTIVRRWDSPVAQGTLLNVQTYVCLGSTAEVGACIAQVSKNL